MKFFYRIIILYFALLIIFTSLIIVSQMIPASKISNHVIQSSKVLQDEGLYPKIFNFKLYQLDNFTDVLMLNLSLSVDSSNPVDAAMMNYYHWEAVDIMNFAQQTEELALNHKERFEELTYTRYWHGYQIFLRPLLTVINYSQIRILNYILFTILLFFCIKLIYKKIGISVAILFVLSLLLINFPLVPLSMQFSTVFYIAFAAIIFILTKKHFLEKQENACYCFLIIGAVTSYLDLLTAPLITLGLPLIIYQLLIRNDKMSLTTIKLSVMWGLGYALLWASKWFVAYLITGVNPFDEVIHQVGVRISNDYKGMEMTIPNICGFIWENFQSKNLTWLLYAGMALIIGFPILYYAFLLKDKKTFWEYAWLLLIIASVPAWYIILRNHSMQHGWFTWRALLVSLFAGLIFLYYTVDWKRIFYKGKQNDD